MEGNVGSSIMSMLVPLVLLLGVRIGSGWRTVFPVMLIMLFVVASFGLPATMHHLKSRDQRADAGGGKLGAGYWRMWLLLFVGVSVEWSLAFWCMTYLLGLPGNSRDLAAAGTVLLGLSMVVGRFVSSRMGHRFSEERRLAVVIAMVLIGFPLYWFRPTVALTFIGLALAGMGVSNFYPLTLALALRRAPGNAATASSFAPVASGSAIGLAPVLLGRLGDLLDIRTALLYIPAGIAIMIAMIAADRVAIRRSHRLDSESKRL
jgi:fucose permease